ncbi:hypothetical protein [Anabaena azotica]|nr:hypothetical protein [Anabaena azotica]
MTVMISGSRSIKRLPQEAIASLDKIMELGYEIIIGDAPGVDALIQQYLRLKGYEKVTVYYAMFNGLGCPRNSNDYPTVGVVGNYVDRDSRLCTIANYGLAIWDGRSKGTRNNIAKVKRTKVITVIA